jgi:transposase InsO family protein
MHGCPVMIVTDPGAAMTGALFRNLCRALGISLVINAVGNARKGQVENANNLVETKFEPGLKLRPVASLDELNTLAKAWRENFNATEIHRRHGQSRNLVWMTIRADQLIKAPSVEVCRELAVAEPENRKVTRSCVSFQGRGTTSRRCRA